MTALPAFADAFMDIKSELSRMNGKRLRKKIFRTRKRCFGKWLQQMVGRCCRNDKTMIDAVCMCSSALLDTDGLCYSSQNIMHCDFVLFWQRISKDCSVRITDRLEPEICNSL